MRESALRAAAGVAAALANPAYEVVVRRAWQRDVDSGGQVRHLIAETLEDLTPLLGRLGKIGRSRGFQ